MRRFIGVALLLNVVTCPLLFAEDQKTQSLLPESGSIFATPLDPATSSPIVTKAVEQKTLIRKMSDLEFQPYIHIDRENIDLETRLGKMYAGYKITVSSSFPRPLLVESINVGNMVAPEGATTAVKKSEWGGLGYALIPFVGMIAGPAVSLRNGSWNARSQQEAEQFSEVLPTGVICEENTIEFKTLVPIGQKPAITIKFVDKEAEAVYLYGNF